MLHVMRDTTFKSNSAGRFIFDSSFVSNQAPGRGQGGGAIHISGSLIISDSTFKSNTAGALYEMQDEPSSVPGAQINSPLGGTQLALFGNFPENLSLSITVGGKAVQRIERPSNREIRFRTPADGGTNQPVVVRQDGRMLHEFTYSYARPFISSAHPLIAVVDCVLAQDYGDNLPIQVLVNGQSSTDDFAFSFIAGQCAEGEGVDMTTKKCKFCRSGMYSGTKSTAPSSSGRPAEVDNVCLDCPGGYYNGIQGTTTCQPCPEGKFTKQSRKQGSVRCDEVSERNMYLVERWDNELQVFVRTAQRCPPLGVNKEAICENGILRYKSGFWHDGLVRTELGRGSYKHVGELNEGSRFYTCPCEHCCQVDERRGDVQCTEGTDGLLCTQCAVGYYLNTEGTCSVCSAADKKMGGAVVLFLLLGALLLGYRFAPWQRHVPPRLLKWVARLSRRVHRLIDEFAVIAMVKIVTSFYQVLLLIHDIYDVPFPRLYLKFLMKWFGWFDFEFLKFARIEC
eukprot:g1103.t1